MKTPDVVKALREISARLHQAGANEFKVAAYANAADHVEEVDNLPWMVARRQLGTIEGVGKSIAAHITELVQTGKLAYLDDLRDWGERAAIMEFDGGMTRAQAEAAALDRIETKRAAR